MCRRPACLGQAPSRPARRAKNGGGGVEEGGSGESNRGNEKRAGRCTDGRQVAGCFGGRRGRDIRALSIATISLESSCPARRRAKSVTGRRRPDEGSRPRCGATPKSQVVASGQRRAGRSTAVDEDGRQAWVLRRRQALTPRCYSQNPRVAERPAPRLPICRPRGACSRLAGWRKLQGTLRLAAPDILLRLPPSYPVIQHRQWRHSKW